MIKSMTGYGSGTISENGKKYTVEIRSVNSRYGDFSIKVPRSCNFLEDPVRKAVSGVISRGKVDVYVNIEFDAAAGSVVKANIPLARAYSDSLHSLAEELGISCDLRADMFLRIPDVITVEKEEEDSEVITADTLRAVNIATESFDAMRLFEGKKLHDDLSSRLDTITDAVKQIEERAPGIINDYRNRLEERIREVLADTSLEESRIMTEVAIFADKVNVNEEVVRLRSHISQFRTMLESDVPVGRKIDFLIQEMNREINTIGSKSNDLDTARIVIDVKAEIEKLREQIQNVE